jgi:hypothetical protein
VKIACGIKRKTMGIGVSSAFNIIDGEFSSSANIAAKENDMVVG